MLQKSAHFAIGVAIKRYLIDYLLTDIVAGSSSNINLMSPHEYTCFHFNFMHADCRKHSSMTCP
jgi:hypothetical protein